MTTERISNTSALSMHMGLFPMSEPKSAFLEGMYIGRTANYRQPFFLNVSDLLNPHMAVVGMSGSGKSYLLKGLVSRAQAYGGCGIIIIDWSGEYEGIAGDLGFGDLPPCADPGAFDIRGAYIARLSRIRDIPARTETALSALRSLSRFLLASPPGGGLKAFIIMDEAWKVLGGSELSWFYREGRKYGIGVISATQMVGDIDNEIMANSSTIILFRLRRRNDFAPLINANLISEGDAERLSSLDIGSCMVLLAYGGRADSGKFFIGRVEGPCQSWYSIDGGIMQLAISGKRFKDATGALGIGGDAKASIIRAVEMNGNRIDLQSLVRLLCDADAERCDVVAYLREIGFDDRTILESYGGYDAAKAK